MNEEKKAILRGIAKNKHYGFPNGSHYNEQVLPSGEHDGVRVTARYNDGYKVEWPDGSTDTVSFVRVKVGPGADFGIHFNTRDKVLKDLI